MLKDIIAPVQAWLLSRGQCVGCGTPLKHGKRSKSRKQLEKVVCKCGRIFMWDVEKKSYRRALFDEI